MSLTYLKLLFKRTLRPLAARLAETGVTNNQVTVASRGISNTVGAFLCAYSEHTPVFAVLPVGLLVRMACATVDGILAIEFRQKSRLGGILNETGDIVSDAARLLPLALVAALSIAPALLLSVLAAGAEFAGILGALLGGDGWLEGPLGKADRSIVLAIIAVTIATLGELPEGALIIVPALAVGLALTIWNRLRFAFATRAESDRR